MDILTLVCLSLSLAADAFVTAVCDGLAYRPKPLKRCAIAVSFGAAQGLMPVIGALIGDKLLGFIDAKDYVAFATLFVVGVLMLIDGFDKTERKKSRLGVKTIAFQAIATSIDALACGLTLSLMSLPLWMDGLAIGLTTAALCAVGVSLAAIIGKRITKPERVKLIGGLILIALALKNLVYCFIWLAKYFNLFERRQVLTLSRRY